MNLLFATSNTNKVHELEFLMPGRIQLMSLADVNFHGDIPEEQATIEGNAIQKAEYAAKKWQLNCFADDTGLEVETLNGKPGVYSARYAGAQKNADDNMNKLLSNLEQHQNRSAQFVTQIALIWRNELHLFSGVLAGTIILEKRGEHGFGYDPIFLPNGYDITLAEMTIEEKNKISHRAIATQKLIRFLKQEMP